MAFIVCIGIIVGGINGFDDGDTGVASWYEGYYSKGEKVLYAAVGSFRNFHDRPYKVVITNRANGKSVIATVRDHCGRCYRDGTGERIIDLSPALFSILSENRLGLGLLKVRVREYAGDKDLVSDRSFRRPGLFRGTVEVWYR